MKLVIDIPNYMYDAIMSDQFGVFSNAPCDVIRKGTPYVECCIEERPIIELTVGGKKKNVDKAEYEAYKEGFRAGFKSGLDQGIKVSKRQHSRRKGGRE